MADSKIDIEVTGLEALKDSSELLEKMRDNAKGLKGHLRESTEFAKQYSTFRPGASSSSGTTQSSPFGSTGFSADQNLTSEYMRTANLFHKASLPFLKAGIGVTAGLARGGYSMAFGGGVTGLSAGINAELQRAFKSSGIFTQTLSGAAMGAASRPRATGRAASGATAAEAEGIESALAKGAEQGVGWGLIQGFGKLAGPLGKVVAGAIAVAGLDIAAVDKSMKDVYGRSRRAGGYGSNLGQLTAFDATTMSRLVDLDSVMSAMGQAKYDKTSDAFVAAHLAGVNPKDYKDPAALAEATILSVQRKIQALPEDTMLTKAHARGFGDLGFSDQNLVRLYSGDQKVTGDLIKKAQGAASGLDISKDEQKAYQDLYTDADLAGQRLKVLSEDILSDQIPAFEKLTGVIDNITEKYRLSPDNKQIGAPGGDVGRSPLPYSTLGPSFWIGDFGSTPGGKYAFKGAGFDPGRGVSKAPIAASEATPIPWGDWWKKLTGKNDLPSEYATPKEFETKGDGHFVLPGSDRVASNIEDIRDAIVNDEGITRTLSDTSPFGVGAGGAPSSYTSEVGTPGGSLAPIYHSGGMGEAGEPRSLTRGAARGTDKGDISGTAVTKPEEAGKYRPVYKLGDADLSDAVVNTIAGEAKAGNVAGTDAVIDNMMNRLGTKAYGPSGNLEQVARARGQYAGYRKAGPEEGAKIRSASRQLLLVVC
jgi:hypothetical protein